LAVLSTARVDVPTVGAVIMARVLKHGGLALHLLPTRCGLRALSRAVRR